MFLLRLRIWTKKGFRPEKKTDFHWLTKEETSKIELPMKIQMLYSKFPTTVNYSMGYYSMNNHTPSICYASPSAIYSPLICVH